MVLVRKWVEVDDHLIEASQEPPKVNIPIMSVRISVTDAWGEVNEVNHEIPVRAINWSSDLNADSANARALLELYELVHAEMYAILKSYAWRAQSVAYTGSDYNAKTGKDITVLDEFVNMTQAPSSKP